MSSARFKSDYSFSWIMLLASLTALGPLSIDMYLPAFSVMASDLNTSIKQVANSLPAFFAGLVVGQLIYGPISDVIGRKKPLYIGLGIFVIASFSCAFVNDHTMLLILRFIQALGGCVGVVVARATIRDTLEVGQASQAFATMMIVMGVAPIIAPVMGSFIITISTWKIIFILLGIIGCINLWCIHFYFQDTLPNDLRKRISFFDSVRSYKNILMDNTFLYACLVCFFSGTAMFTYINAASSIFMDHFQLSKSIFTYFFVLNSFGIILFSYLGKLLSRFCSVIIKLKIGIFSQIMGASILMICQLLKINSLFFTVMGLFMVVSAVGLTTPNSTAIAMSNQASRAGGASAVLGAFHFSGGMISGLVLYILVFDTLLNTTIIMMITSFLSLCVFIRGYYIMKSSEYVGCVKAQ